MKSVEASSRQQRGRDAWWHGTDAGPIKVGLAIMLRGLSDDQKGR